MEDDTQPNLNNNTDKLQQDLEEAILQAQGNLEGWKRAAADFENYKKRKEAENKELVEFAKEVTVTKMLPTLDSLEQALKHMPEAGAEEFAKKYQNWQTGVNGIVMQLDKVLEEMGVRKIEALGKKFDPHFHEAVREVEGGEDGMVAEELQTGFELNGKVIRPSQVVITKKP
jgi:molecular chaperone GrpE